MGCSGSKVDDLPVVSLCRERSRFIKDVVQQRYLLSAAHLSYIRSLREVGAALEAFIDSEHVSAVASSPVLPLPTRRKSDPVLLPASSSPHPSAFGGGRAGQASSDSDHHLHFESDEEESLSDDYCRLHDNELPQPAAFRDPVVDLDYGRMTTPPYSAPNQYFMRSRPTPSVVYEERLQSPEKVRWENSYPYYPNNSGFAGFFNSDVGTPSSIPPPPPYSTPPFENRIPPPPPAHHSAWDFLNLFGGYEGYSSPYFPRKYSDSISRDSREVREEEGIPELEEDTQSEAVKEIRGNPDVHPGWYYKKNHQFHGQHSIMSDEDESGDNRVKSEVKSSVGSDSEEDDQRDLVDKDAIENSEASKGGNASEFPGTYDAIEAVKQVKIQFNRASESGSEVSAILEVGKLPYRHRNAVHRVSVRMLGTMALPMSSSSRPPTSKATDPQLPPSAEPPSPALLDFENALWLRSRKLSTTLEKLYTWEKKLFEEVKTEERLRIIQERKRKQLKKMNDKGSDAQKVEATRALIRSLSTKIHVSIHFVDSVSTKINEARDEELWPQLIELLHGLVKMWKTMLECHQNQCQIISQAKNVGIQADDRDVVCSDFHLRATVRLQLELLNWMSSFYVWVAAQKGYVRALNCWLLKCILHEPEETPDGIVPFSPGRIGAPPIFVICNRWWQAIEGISEKEVTDAVLTLSVAIFHLWKRYSAQYRSRAMLTNSPKDMERRIQALQRDEEKIQKAWDALNKKLFLIPVENGLSSTNQNTDQTWADTFSGIKAGLKQIFDAIVKFIENSLKAYEDLKP